jgi:hypothetical protein
VRDGGRAFVILDGKRQPPADDVEAFVFSPDSRRYAYWSRMGSQWRVVVDGKKGLSYSGNLSLVIDGTHPIFSPDSKRIAYTAWKGGTGKRADIVVCGNETRGTWDAVIEGARAVAVVDGVEGPDFERVRDLKFSADSRRVAYTGFTAGLFGIQMVDGRALSSAPALYQGLEFSRDGRRVAFVAGPRRDESPAALADGTECAGDVAVAVIDGQPGPVYDSILLSGESFQPDGAVEYLATRNKTVYRVRELPPTASSTGPTGNRPR